ncbi:hypothetical protein [uncultured Desulfuromusa sp.]|uniref:hypothetical protein n=1 Tax=uncultured Desulfuromusa sp. TaxID=219183 RepID=UPI002AA7C811|nr:hypothetical protein [uncultured Desulfuromusa sp.]
MELFLQFGHGMMEHCRQLVSRWGGGTVILSPRDLTEDQLSTVSSDVIKRGGSTMLDPQFYDPRGDHHGLVKHTYWPENYTTSLFLPGAQLTQLLNDLIYLNDIAKTGKFILPSLYCERVDGDWLAVQGAIIDESVRLITDKPRFATICISGEALRFEEQVEALLNASEDWDVQGYYVVPEHPNGTYLVDDPMWLANLLNLCSGLKLQDRKVVVGYASHQMLPLACAGVNAIASGTWLNVRSFSTKKFQEPMSGQGGRRATWYYSPQTLSEYKLPFLDIAFSQGVLPSLAVPVTFSSKYADVLFSGAQPTTTTYSEQNAFRHYLDCVHYQCSQLVKASFQETVDSQLRLLDDVEGTIRVAHRAGVRGQDRDFSDCIDVSRAALGVFVDNRGFVMNRQW